MIHQILPFVLAFLCLSTNLPFDAQASVIPLEDQTNLRQEIPLINNSSGSLIINGTRTAKQTSTADNIDVDGPYSYLPRVVHGVNNIVKGLLAGSINQVMHGAFGLAPEDVAEDLIERYNEVMGVPDPDDLPKGVRRGTRKPKIPNAEGLNVTTSVPANNKTESPIKSKVESLEKDEDDDDEDDDEDDFD